MQTPNFREEYISQIPALQLLHHLGYDYLTPSEIDELRGGRLNNVILEDILLEWLAANNSVDYRRRSYSFTDSNIKEAVSQLKRASAQSAGFLKTNENIFDLLTLGISLPQTIDGDTKSYSLRYIDWENPYNNVFHVTDEFVVERKGSRETRRPDIVCFVNGIPLTVIECKRPDKTAGSEKGVIEAVTQMLCNQKPAEIPQLFAYSQLLMAISTNDALYATTGTPKKFWAVWKEEEDIEQTVQHLINQELGA